MNKGLDLGATRKKLERAAFIGKLKDLLDECGVSVERDDPGCDYCFEGDGWSVGIDSFARKE